jgi:hypothetical protein
LFFRPTQIGAKCSKCNIELNDYLVIGELLKNMFLEAMSTKPVAGMTCTMCLHLLLVAHTVADVLLIG